MKKVIAALLILIIIVAIIFAVMPQAEAQAVTVLPGHKKTMPSFDSDKAPALPESESTWEPSEEDVIYLAKTLYGECRGVKDKAQQAAVAWCILNRVNSPRFKGDTVREIVTAPYQFAGYSDSFPVTDELKYLAIDVLVRWHAELAGEEDVGRTLPADYFFFHGDGRENYFRQQYEKTGDYWDWSLPDPYDAG